MEYILHNKNLILQFVDILYIIYICMYNVMYCNLIEEIFNTTIS